MDEMQNSNIRPVNPRRRRRTKMDIFKESYLPVLIVGVALIFIIVTIIGSAVQSAKRKKLNEQAMQQPADNTQSQDQQFAAEASALIMEADALASEYYYDEAIATVESFSGNMEDYPELMNAYQRYSDLKANAVAWEDPSKVLNLSFQILIVDPLRAFQDDIYASSYNRNFVTVEEFKVILDQLYSNDYVLVSKDDIVEQGSDGKFQAKTLYLPQGKKPLILTQNQVNYYTYMIDGDADHLPDKNGDGFASKLILDSSGKLVNEYVDKNGNTLTGEYDLIPILNSFIAAHPDFSYQGAKAIISVSGSDGLFGYRTNPDAKEWLKENYNQEVESAKKIAQAIRDDGYEIACYTYDNISYGKRSLSEIQEDLKKWKVEVTPILGDIDILVFAQESDLTNNTPYSGDVFNELMDAGFRYYFGFCLDGKLWADVQTNYFRQARIMVKGASLKYNASWFEGIIKPVEILSSTRGTIPQG